MDPKMGLPVHFAQVIPSGDVAIPTIALGSEPPPE